MMLATSCGFTKIAKIARKVEIVGLSEIELKGYSALRLAIELHNNSPHPITLSEGRIAINIDGEQVAILVQVGEATATAQSHEIVKSLWRLEQTNFLSMVALAPRLAEQRFDLMTIDLSANLSSGRSSHNITRHNIDISKFVGYLGR